MDVLVVLDDVRDYAAEVARTSELVAELSLKSGRSISCVYVSEFFLNVRGEAIPA